MEALATNRRCLANAASSRASIASKVSASSLSSSGGPASASRWPGFSWEAALCRRGNGGQRPQHPAADRDGPRPRSLLAYRPHLEQSVHHLIGVLALPWTVVAAAIVPGLAFLMIAFLLLGYSGGTGNGGKPELVLGIVALIPAVVLGLPLLAAAAGWLLAGRQPPALSRQPIEQAGTAVPRGRQLGAIKAGEPNVVVGWSLAAQGRKILAGSALFTASGQAVAMAQATWIRLRYPAPPPRTT